MSLDPTATPTKFVWKRYFSPQTIIGRFTARRTVYGAGFLALIFGAYVAAKSTSYVASYPTAAARIGLATSFGNNIGLNMLFGLPHHIDTVLGFTAWNTLNVMAIIGSIWAFSLATKTFRGEEDAGRSELLLAGQTTERQAAVNTLFGLGISLLVMYTVVALIFIVIGRIHGINYNPSAGLFFALAATSGAALFLTVGAVASQLMPTRGRAMSLAAAVFGVFFLLRASADVTSAHWLLNLTPLGWIEKMQPLYAPQPIWLLPVVGLVIALGTWTVYLAGRRDLGASTFADRESAKPRTFLLNHPLTMSLRLTLGSNVSWLVAVGLGTIFFSVLTKSAAQAFSSSLSLTHALNRIVQASQLAGGRIFLGIVFFLLMLLVMTYAASAVGAIRNDEAEGYLDNLLVRPVSRLQWLGNRLLLVVAVIFLAGLLAGTAAWAGEASQQAGILFHPLLLAGLNIMAPALFILGVGIFGLGVAPRLTTLLAYGVIGWSFLIEMVSSGLNLNQWLLDTSILHHVALAPAASVDWQTDAILVGLGIILGVIGALVFNARDLASA